MFLDDPTGTRLKEYLQPWETTDPPAEVLVFNNIPIKYILSVGFENEDLLEIANSKYNKGVASNIDFFMAKKYFKPREILFW
jgi:hypothetical protein